MGQDDGSDDKAEFKPKESPSGKGSGLFQDSVRKAVLTGMSALLTTEEGIRNVVNDLRLPKEAITAMLQQTERSRREIFRMVTDELKGMLRNVDIPGELRKALTGLKLEVRAEIRFVDAKRSDVSVRTHVKSREGRSTAPHERGTAPHERGKRAHYDPARGSRGPGARHEKP